MTARAPSPAAAKTRAAARNRQARYRERRALGRRVVTVEIGQDTLEALVWRGLLTADDLADRDALGQRLGRFFARLLEAKAEQRK